MVFSISTRRVKGWFVPAIIANLYGCRILHSWIPFRGIGGRSGMDQACRTRICSWRTCVSLRWLGKGVGVSWGKELSERGTELTLIIYPCSCSDRSGSLATLSSWLIISAHNRSYLVGVMRTGPGE